MNKIAIFHGQVYQIDAKSILANNVVLPGETNPHNVRPWLVISLFGPCGVVWADCMDDALDEIVDADLGKGFEVNVEDYTEDEPLIRCGNDGRLCDLTDVRAYVLDLLADANRFLIPRFKIARDGSETLDF